MSTLTVAFPFDRKYTKLSATSDVGIIVPKRSLRMYTSDTTTKRKKYNNQRCIINVRNAHAQCEKLTENNKTLRRVKHVATAAAASRAFQFAIRIDSIRFVMRIDSNLFVL